MIALTLFDSKLNFFWLPWTLELSYIYSVAEPVLVLSTPTFLFSSFSDVFDCNRSIVETLPVLKPTLSNDVICIPFLQIVHIQTKKLYCYFIEIFIFMFYCNQRYNYLYDQIVITQNSILTVLYSLKCKFYYRVVISLDFSTTKEG